MPELIHNLLAPVYDALKIAVGFSDVIDMIICVLLFTALTFVLTKLTYLFFNKTVRWFVKKSKTTWDDYLYEAGLFNRMSKLLAFCFAYFFISLFFPKEAFIIILMHRLVLATLVFISAHILAAILDGINLIYQSSAGEQSKRKPIKGYLQLVKVCIYIVGGVLVITTVLAKSPVGILSGLGAMSAVLLFVCKDLLMGFVSGIQIASDDMVRIGDWIEMPKYNANGIVIDVTLQSVVVKNFDMSISTIPIYSIVSDSFYNWRSLNESEGRRIKRSILIDVQSIHFLSNAEIEKLSKIPILSDYMKTKCEEIDVYNTAHTFDVDDHVSNRQLTNIGTFRIYATAYLKTLAGVVKDMACIVRQLQSDENGLPLEIICFSQKTDLDSYEKLQADIFDHLLAVIPEFSLAVFQRPSGRNTARPCAAG
ncbi:MAG: mechanosensitive ion channel [Treponemataceae bacterium]|nr:MAG: mechanosensitive ion channel [Treponemataceae bacterium]